MLELSWYILFIGLLQVILLYYILALRGLKTPIRKQIKMIILTLLIVIIWLGYIFILGQKGILLDTSMPPRLALLIIGPLLLFTIVFLTRNRKSKVLNSIPTHIPIAYQSFRILIEVLFYFTFLKGILPEEVTFAGNNYDIIIGLSAPLVAYFAYKKQASKKVLIAWNISGILLVGTAAFTFITSFYFPEFWGASEPLISSEFTSFPYILLPAFFMPSAIFMHVLSIIQLINKD